MAQALLYVNILMLIIVRTNISTLVVDTLNHCAILVADNNQREMIMKVLPSDEWHEDLGASIFICFDRDQDGVIQGAPPELYYGSGYLEEDFDFDKWTHFIDGDFNFIFEDADPINFPSKRKKPFEV